MVSTIIPFSEKRVISSRREYGAQDRFKATYTFQSLTGYKFDLATVRVIKLFVDGREGSDWEGPQLQIISETALMVIGTTYYHQIGTPGHLEFQVTADMVRS